MTINVGLIIALFVLALYSYLIFKLGTFSSTRTPTCPHCGYPNQSTICPHCLKDTTQC